MFRMPWLLRSAMQFDTGTPDSEASCGTPNLLAAAVNSPALSVNPLDLAVAAKEPERPNGFLVALVLDRDASDQVRVEVLDVHGVLETSNSVFPTLLVGHQVVGRDHLSPPLGLALIRPSKMPLLGHFAPAASIAVLVERLVAKQMFRRFCLRL